MIEAAGADPRPPPPRAAAAGRRPGLRRAAHAVGIFVVDFLVTVIVIGALVWLAEAYFLPYNAQIGLQ